ncbi:MAG TPA: NTP transferase domain-containing protein, partial [Chthoniobacterales bacterium]
SLPWLGGQRLLPWMMESLAANGWQPLVVTGPEYFDSWSRELGGERVALNPHPEAGKTTSLAAGISRLPARAEWILLTSVDQPRLPGLYLRLRRAVPPPGGQTLVVPDWAGRRGHPVVLAASLLPELRALDEDSRGLRGFLDRHDSELMRMPGEPPGSLDWDVNTPEAYQKALAYFREPLAAAPKI